MKILSKLKKLTIIQETYKLLFTLVGLLPADRKLVMFESYLGKQYSCNPRAIYEYMRVNKPEYKLYWSIDSRYTETFKELDIPYIKRFSIKWLFCMARAGYWVTNSRMPLWIPKPKHTVYLQTWHGTPLKRLAQDMKEVHMPGTNTEAYKEEFYRESRNWDFLISPNAYSTEIFRRAFQYDKQILETGYPRNDMLLSPEKERLAQEIKRKLKLPMHKKVVLYAPTWRDNQYYEKGRYKFDVQLDLKEMQRELGEDYVILLRMHYLVAENLDLKPFHGFAYDCSNYVDIRDLYLISDLLITDYSSVFFDFANLWRPILFYVYDIEIYRGELRGFYFDLEKNAPGPLVTTTVEIIDYIKTLDLDTHNNQDYQKFHDHFCHFETGESTRKVVGSVFN
ncbi:CDP-glycerol glycerophosphotransferase family protein [Mesobacillus zeae]